MVIEEDKQEIENNPVLEDGLSTEGIDPEFLSDLQESQKEFESWLENIRSRREKSVSLLEEVRALDDRNLYTTIPNHFKDMPEGTLRGILKQAENLLEDF